MRSGRLWAVTGALSAGVVVLVAGTFAPWLQSGQVTRNSYRTAGLLQRLLDVGGIAGAALDALPLLGLVCAGAAAAFVLGWRRTAAGVLAVLALALGALAIAALNAPGSSEVQVDRSGPVIVLAGSGMTILACAALILVLRADKFHRDTAGSSSPWPK